MTDYGERSADSVMGEPDALRDRLKRAINFADGGEWADESVDAVIAVLRADPVAAIRLIRPGSTKEF